MFRFSNMIFIKAYVFFQGFMSEKKGVTAIEYALIAVAISAMLFVVLGSGGEDGIINKIKASFKAITDGLGATQQQAGTK
ncbi:hypothetical protein BKH40_02455 [Helicobacter sp. 11S02629-2]|nr:hypothetical protein BKH40_02455 [Helicobacter sp. 11S02629-2]